MALDNAVRAEDRSGLYGGDNGSGAALTHQEIHPLALEGAKRLISHHSQKTPVMIKSWGSPEVVYEEVRQSLIDFGYQIGMAENMAEKLVEQAEQHAEASRAKYGANIIALKIEVSKAEPAPQFETGAMEVQRIDGLTNKAQIAGATSIAIGINTGGTTTTALRDSVSEILQAIGGSSLAVWVHFEAPNKSELQGIANEAAMAAVAEIGGGGLSPEKVEAVLEQIQSLVEAGLIAPEILAVVQNLNQIQTLAAEGKIDAAKALAQTTIENISAVLDAGTAPPEIIAATVEALEVIADRYDIKSDIDMKSLMDIKLEVLAEMGAGELKDILQQLNDLDSLPAELAELLDGMDIENLSIDDVKEALMGQGELATSIQKVVVALANPDIQAALPPAVQNSVTQFIEARPDLVQMVETKVVIAALNEAIVEATASTPQMAEIAKAIVLLQAGEPMTAVAPQVLEQVAQKMGEATPPSLTVAITAPKLEVGTIQNLQAMLHSEVLPAETKQAIENYLQAPENVAALKEVKQALGDVAPPQVINAFTKPLPPAALSSQLQSIVTSVMPSSDTPLTATQKVRIESMNSAIKMLQDMPPGHQMPPAKAEVILRKIDEGRTLVKDPAVNAQIDKIREQVMDRTQGGREKIPEVVRTGCDTCATKNCANCKGDQRAAVQGKSDMKEDRGLGNKVSQPPAAQNDNRPPEIKGMEEKAVLRAAIQDLKGDGTKPLSAEAKKPIEALSSALKTLEAIERNGVETISKEQAEAILQKLDEGAKSVKDYTQIAQIEQLREQIMDRTEGGRENIAADVRNGVCGTCTTKNCGSCKGDQVAAARGKSDMKEDRGFDRSRKAQPKAAAA